MALTLEMPVGSIEETTTVSESPDAAEAVLLLEAAEPESEQSEPEAVPFEVEKQTQASEQQQSEASKPEEPAGGGCDVHSSVDQQASNGATITPAEPASQPGVSASVAAVAPTTQAPTTSPPTKPQVDARSRYLLAKSSIEERISALTIEECKLKTSAKLAKKEREVLTEQLIDLIDNWESDGDQDDDDDTDANPATAGGDTAVVSRQQSTATADPISQPASQPPAEDAAAKAKADADEQERYRKVLEASKVEELGLPPKITEKLQETGATTIWGLEQLRSEISQGRAKWPKGIGPAKVTDIENAIMQWMSRNQDTWAPVTLRPEDQQTEQPAAEQQPPRTAAEIDAANEAAEQQQDKERAAEVAEAQPRASVPDHDPLDDL